MNPAWQTSYSTIQESVLHLLLSKDFSDVVFIVGENKEKIHAHKLILMTRSPVFAAMFSDRWSNETDSSGVGDVEEGILIPDVSAETFKLFLKYVYSNEFSCENLDEAHEVLSVGHKYDVNGLEDKCSSILKAGISVSNAISFHQFALNLNLDDLTKATEEFILMNARTVFSNDQFLETPSDILTKFLSSDDLCIDEVVAFHALVRWAENRCKILELDSTGENKRKSLGDLLYLIRFPVMNQQEFAAVVIRSPGILSTDEVQNLFVYFSGFYISTVPKLQFNTTPRFRFRLASVVPYSKPSLGEQGIVWDTNTYGEWNEQLIFSVDRDICINEVEIYPLFLSSTPGQITLPQYFAVFIDITAFSQSQGKLGSYQNERFDISCSERIQFGTGDGTGVRISKSSYCQVQLKITGGSFITTHQKEPLSPSASAGPRGENPVNFRFSSNTSRHNNNVPRAPVGQIKAIHFCTPPSLSK